MNLKAMDLTGMPRGKSRSMDIREQFWVYSVHSTRGAGSEGVEGQPARAMRVSWEENGPAVSAPKDWPMPDRLGLPGPEE